MKLQRRLKVGSHLKDLLIQDPGAEERDAVSADHGPAASLERPGPLLPTVHEDADALLFHAESHSMPPVPQRGRSKVSTDRCVLWLACGVEPSLGLC